MNKLRCLLAAAFLAASSALAQNAALTADQTALAPAGGMVMLTATASYEGEPGALGWSIALPADWSLVSISGPNVPAIAPEPGASGTLEFAFTSVPAGRAEFSVVVKYPANTSAATATPKVLVRSGGKLATLTPAPVQLRGSLPATPQKSRD
jgi:hypothetical protein